MKIIIYYNNTSDILYQANLSSLPKIGEKIMFENKNTNYTTGFNCYVVKDIIHDYKKEQNSFLNGKEFGPKTDYQECYIYVEQRIFPINTPNEF